MGKFSFPRLIIRMPWANRSAQDDFCTGTTELHGPRTHQPHNSSQLPSLNVCRQDKENTDSIQKKRKKKRLNEKGTQVELGMREDIHDLDLAHWRLARETWRTERGNMREIKALYGEIFRLHQLLEEIGVDKGVIKQRSNSSIICPVSPTLPAFPWYNHHRNLANSQSEPDQHAAGTQKDPPKKHSIFPPLDTQSCNSPDKWPHSPSKMSHPHASHRFAVPSHLLASGPPARMRQTHPQVHPRSPLTGQAKVKDEVKRPETASSEELSEEVQRRGAEIASMYKAQLKERMAQKRKEEILKKMANSDDKNDDTEASCSSAVKRSNTPATAPERPASPEATPVRRENTQGDTQQDLAEVVNVLKRQSSDLYLPDDVSEESLTWKSIYEELCPLAHRVNTEADYIKALRVITENAVTPSCSSEDDVSQSVSEDTSQEESSESEESMSGHQQRCLHRDPYGKRDRKEIDSGKMEGRFATANAMSMMASRGIKELNAMSYADRIKYFKYEAKRNEEMMKIEKRKEKARDEELKKWEKRQKKLNEEERKRTENMEKNKLEEQRKREKAEMKLKIEHEKKRQEQEKKREKKERKQQEMQQKARAKEEKKRAEEEKKMEKQRMEEERNREKERMKVLEMQQKAREKEEKRRKEEQKRRLKIQQEQEKEEQKRQTRIRDEDKKRAELQRIKAHEARFKMEMEKLYEREERNAQIEREKRRALCQKKGQTQRAKQVVAYEVAASTSDASVRREEREQRPETAHAQSAKRRTRKKQKKAADEASTTFQ
ncbi:golgin subfamily A member 6-like protein 26 [Oncorhynchus masou masou]|uniref:golgin subfamily A member 6-like protein 26 n=1 Tax=Oncorhynchus masou masou TaxID=90313 RepID=UPI003182CE9E